MIRATTQVGIEGRGSGDIKEAKSEGCGAKKGIYRMIAMFLICNQ